MPTFWDWIFTLLYMLTVSLRAVLSIPFRSSSRRESCVRSPFGRSGSHLGAMLMPASFKAGRPGSDIHYSPSLPMRVNSEIGPADLYGELVGALGVYVVDGASLSSLSAKPRTQTIMANANRIARHFVCTLSKVST